MTSLSSVLKKVLAGIAIIGGVVSFITFGILTGVKVANAETEAGITHHDERSRFMLALEE